MKQLTCEMCGSTDLLKQDGVFVCQTCGMKYSVEEAKKMMIEGTVEVQGTVKVDNTDFIERYLQNARRAMQKMDWEEAEKYYNMVEQNAPTNIEAIFYSSYAKARMLLIESDYFKREHGFEVLCNSTSIIDDNYVEGNIETIKDITAKINEICKADFVYKTNDSKIKETHQLFLMLHLSWAESLVNIATQTSIYNEKNIAFSLASEQLNAREADNYFILSEKETDGPHKRLRDTVNNWLYENNLKYKTDFDINLQLLKEKEELKALETAYTAKMNSYYVFQNGKKEKDLAIVVILIGIFIDVIAGIITSIAFTTEDLLCCFLWFPLVVVGIYTTGKGFSSLLTNRNYNSEVCEVAKIQYEKAKAEYEQAKLKYEENS